MRVLIGFILALSVSFACDQPYEEVGGYKIGCPFVVTDEYKLVDEEPAFNSKTYTKNIDGVFDKVNITVMNEDVEFIRFDKNNYGKINQKDIDDMLVVLNKRWGEGKNDGKTSLYYTWSPDNSAIGEVVFTSSGPSSSFPDFTLWYTSKKLLDLIESHEGQDNDSQEEKRQEELSTY